MICRFMRRWSFIFTVIFVSTITTAQLRQFSFKKRGGNVSPSEDDRWTPDGVLEALEPMKAPVEEEEEPISVNARGYHEVPPTRINEDLERELREQAEEELRRENKKKNGFQLAIDSTKSSGDNSPSLPNTLNRRVPNALLGYMQHARAEPPAAAIVEAERNAKAPHTLYTSALDAHSLMEEEEEPQNLTGDSATEIPSLLPRSIRRPVPTIIRDRIIKASQPNHRDDKDKPKTLSRLEKREERQFLRDSIKTKNTEESGVIALRQVLSENEQSWMARMEREKEESRVRLAERLKQEREKKDKEEMDEMEQATTFTGVLHKKTKLQKKRDAERRVVEREEARKEAKRRELLRRQEERDAATKKEKEEKEREKQERREALKRAITNSKSKQLGRREGVTVEKKTATTTTVRTTTTAEIDEEDEYSVEDEEDTRREEDKTTTRKKEGGGSLRRKKKKMVSEEEDEEESEDSSKEVKKTKRKSKKSKNTSRDEDNEVSEEAVRKKYRDDSESVPQHRDLRTVDENPERPRRGYSHVKKSQESSETHELKSERRKRVEKERHHDEESIDEEWRDSELVSEEEDDEISRLGKYRGEHGRARGVKTEADSRDKGEGRKRDHGKRKRTRNQEFEEEKEDEKNGVRRRSSRQGRKERRRIEEDIDSTEKTSRKEGEKEMSSEEPMNKTRKKKREHRRRKESSEDDDEDDRREEGDSNRRHSKKRRDSRRSGRRKRIENSRATDHSFSEEDKIDTESRDEQESHEKSERARNDSQEFEHQAQSERRMRKRKHSEESVDSEVEQPRREYGRARGVKTRKGRMEGSNEDRRRRRNRMTKMKEESEEEIEKKIREEESEEERSDESGDIDEENQEVQVVVREERKEETIGRSIRDQVKDVEKEMNELFAMLSQKRRKSVIPPRPIPVGSRYPQRLFEQLQHPLTGSESTNHRRSKRSAGFDEERVEERRSRKSKKRRNEEEEEEKRTAKRRRHSDEEMVDDEEVEESRRVLERRRRKHNHRKSRDEETPFEIEGDAVVSTTTSRPWSSPRRGSTQVPAKIRVRISDEERAQREKEARKRIEREERLRREEWDQKRQRAAENKKQDFAEALIRLVCPPGSVVSGSGSCSSIAAAAAVSGDAQSVHSKLVGVTSEGTSIVETPVPKVPVAPRVNGKRLQRPKETWGRTQQSSESEFVPDDEYGVSSLFRHGLGSSLSTPRSNPFQVDELPTLPQLSLPTATDLHLPAVDLFKLLPPIRIPSGASIAHQQLQRLFGLPLTSISRPIILNNPMNHHHHHHLPPLPLLQFSGPSLDTSRSNNNLGERIYSSRSPLIRTFSSSEH